VQNARVPGMLHGRVVRPPQTGAKHMHTRLVLWGWNPDEGRTPVATPEEIFVQKATCGPLQAPPVPGGNEADACPISPCIQFLHFASESGSFLAMLNHICLEEKHHISEGWPASDVLWLASRMKSDVDLRSNIAAEARAKIVYERLIDHTQDPSTIDTLQFLMTREITHMKAFRPR
jgi:hypothetical protein